MSHYHKTMAYPGFLLGGCSLRQNSVRACAQHTYVNSAQAGVHRCTAHIFSARWIITAKSAARVQTSKLEGNWWTELETRQGWTIYATTMVKPRFSIREAESAFFSLGQNYDNYEGHDRPTLCACAVSIWQEGFTHTRPIANAVHILKVLTFLFISHQIFPINVS